MRAPISWLADHVDIDLDADALGVRMASTGSAVEEVIHQGVPTANDNLANFRIGKVISAEQHPNADRLRVCIVDTGDTEPRQIVCGAPNVAAGQTVAVAVPGALLPGGMKISVAKLRGVESAGMICSSRELELGDEHDGIMVLSGDLTAGSRVADTLPIAESVIDFEITSNRPDCLSIAGLAKEAAATLGREYRPPSETEPAADGLGKIADLVTIDVEAPDLCPRYMGRVFVDIVHGESPPWMQGRLRAAGMRPISNVVDITNYVMLLTGQPLHAFDLDRLAGPRIIVRRATPGETIETLDGVTRTLTDRMLVIADGERPVAIAGIMGGGDAEFSEATTRVLLESAAFNGPSILGTSLALGLRSESSGRFEKGLPRELAARAMTIASRLLVEHCGAKLVPGTLDVGTPSPERAPITLRHARVGALLGVDIDPAESAELLTRVGCVVTPGPDSHEVQIPFERANDLTREVDLIEEVLRLHGLDEIPAILPRTGGVARRTLAQTLRERLADRLVARGLSETISYRFVSEADADRMQMSADDPRRQVVRLAHPMSEEMAVMRRSMLPGLLRAASRNQAHQRMSGGLFELGRTYAPREDGMADEREFLAVLRFGPETRGHWRRPAEPVDIHAGIGLFEELAQIAGINVTADAATAPYFHPTRRARLASGEDTIGWVGEMHPLVLRNFEVRGPAVAVVMDLDVLTRVATATTPAFSPILTLPASTRDLALIFADDVAAARIQAVATSTGGDLVRGAQIFDRYVGEQVGEGRVSLAIRLTIADPERTLTDEEIEAPVAAVIAALTKELGAELRAAS